MFYCSYCSYLYYCSIILLSYCWLHNAVCVISRYAHSCRSVQFTIYSGIFFRLCTDRQKKKKRDDKLKEKNNSEPYGLASSSKNTVKISKTDSESDNNNARNSINRKKSKKSQLKSKNDIEHKEKRKLRILNSEDEDEEYAMERKGQEKADVLIVSYRILLLNLVNQIGMINWRTWIIIFRKLYT